jgi:predicted extracellular nuclease
MAEIFISEYIEGSSNNKAIELYNPTGVVIDLAAGNYQLDFYFNGNTTAAKTINLTGSINADSVYLLAHGLASFTTINGGSVNADQTDIAPPNWFNGNDALVLKKNGVIIDAIGQIGFDPGSEWGSGLTSTQDNTLRRKSQIVRGDTNPYDAFDPALEWEGFATNTFDGLNVHHGANITKISAIQGSGNISPLVDQIVLIEAIATGDFQGINGLGGFFVQEEDSDIDSDPNTSEAIFINDGNSPAVDINVGDLVRITGTVTEADGLTQLTNPNITIISSGNPLPTVTTINNLVAANSASLEPYEGMRVNLTETLTVSDYFNLGKFGEITLSVNGIPTQFTQTNAPSVTGYTDYQTEVANRQIILDDGSQQTFPNPLIFGRNSQPLSTTNLLRGGDTVTDISGILDYRFGDYRIQNNSGVNFNPVNDRPATPPEVGGTLKVASFNLQNYFTTIDDGSNGALGADSTTELIRQTDKLVAALASIDADIVGLMELENNGYGVGSAISDLVDGLNAVLGAETYAFVNPGLSQLGSDRITVGFIYKPSQVDLFGAAATKNDGAFANFNRQPLAQTFAEKATGEKFTVAVNHFKSKESGTGLPQDSDRGDGQGQSNFTRTQAAQDLNAWLSTDPTNSNDPDFLIIGDLNAYAQEDPITTFKNSGYTNLIESFHGSDAYSFNFGGQLGYLDHALANQSLTSQVTGVGEWHINADEPNIFDYNEDNLAALYQANPFRSSDHDPVVIGLNLSVVSDDGTTDDGTTDDGATDNSSAANQTDNLPTDNSSADNQTDNSLPANQTDNKLPANQTDNLPADNSSPANQTNNLPTDNSSADNQTDNSLPANQTDNKLPANQTDNLPADNSSPVNQTNNLPADNSSADNQTDNSLPANQTDNNLPTNDLLLPSPPLEINSFIPLNILAVDSSIEIVLSDYISTSSLGDGILNSPYQMDIILLGNHNFDDNLTGEYLNEAIAPLGGNNFVRGMEGHDSIEGSHGSDTLNGNQGNDLVNGGLGNDSLHGGKNNDTVNGGMGDDTLFGDWGNDVLDGWEGNDFLNGNRGNDWVDGGEGNDTLHGGKDDDTLIGGIGNDWLFGDLGNDSLLGGDGQDIFVLQIGRGSDVIADFTKNTDKVGLAGGLTFDQLTILDNNQVNNQHTLIKVGDELLATLYNIDASQITADDFLLLG